MFVGHDQNQKLCWKMEVMVQISKLGASKICTRGKRNQRQKYKVAFQFHCRKM